MNKIAIVVSTCDLYSDCWKPLFCSLRKYWPDCKYPIYLISNNKDCEEPGVTTIKVGEHLGWGSNTKKALPQIDAEYILWLQEDFFLESECTTERIEKNLAFCENENVDYLRLCMPYRDKYVYKNNPSYCVDDLSVRYSLCMFPAIWKKSKLQEFCIEGWTGWDYEAKIRSYVKEKGISVNAYVIHSSMKKVLGFAMMESTGIRKGIWTREGYHFLEENGFFEEMAGRKVEGKFMSWCMRQHHPLLRIPCAIIIRIMQKCMSK